MNLKFKEDINDILEIGRLFTKDKIYDFIPVDNRYTRITMKEYNFIGYIKKDDEGYKRWMGKEFKEKYFNEC